MHYTLPRCKNGRVVKGKFKDIIDIDSPWDFQNITINLDR